MSWEEPERSRVTIGLGDENHRESRRAITLLTDPWVFACRLPAGTRQLPSAAELVAGRLVIPLLSPLLIEQADRFFSQLR